MSHSYSMGNDVCGWNYSVQDHLSCVVFALVRLSQET